MFFILPGILRKGMNMTKIVWIEESNAAGLSFLSKRRVRSRRKRTVEFDIGAFLDKAVAVAMYGWTVVLSIATAAVLVRIFA